MGFIKVIITTNFDRLLESALNEIGIVPDVISNTDQVKGVTPLIHSRCTIIKINGDYMDTRIKNTEDELSEYDSELCEFIDRVFDEFGLIICGWSGEWDIALRQSIYRCKNNRYSTYWLKRGALSESAQKICDFKKASLIEISDADTFFDQLKDNLTSINDLEQKGNVLSRDLLCVKLKRLLPDVKNIITVNDLINDSCQQAAEVIKKIDWTKKPDSNTIKANIEKMELAYDVLLHLLALGSFWGGKEYEFIWKNCFKNTFNMNYLKSGLELWGRLAQYPSTLILYTLLMTSILTENYTFLTSVLNEIKNTHEYDNQSTISSTIHPAIYIDSKTFNQAIFNGNHKIVPLSERMLTVMKLPMKQIISNNDEYTLLFDKAEYFYAANYCYYESKKRNISLDESTAPIGCFGYKMHYGYFEKMFSKEIDLKDNWSAIQAGFFGGSFENFEKCNQVIKKLSNKIY